jgi:hypothetical protein
MRRFFMRERTTQDGLKKLFGERKPKVRRPLTDLQALAVVLSFFVGLAAAGFAAFALLAWLAWESHEFGGRDLRYLVFVRGTLLERVGVIDAQPGTVVYGGQGRDGTASGRASARYTSSVEGQIVLTHFVERCKALGLHVTVREPEAGETFRIATCGRTANDEFPVGINVSGANPSEVVMAEDIDDGL